MSEIHETFSVLTQKVGALLDTLADLPLDSDHPEGDRQPVGELIERYIHRIEDIGITAAELDDLGLSSVCALFQGMVEELAGQRSTLTDDERDLLEAWPILIMTYLESSEDPDAVMGLVDHLKSPRWPTPLKEEDEEGLMELLALSSEDAIADEPVAQAIENDRENANQGIADDEPEPAEDATVDFGMDESSMQVLEILSMEVNQLQESLVEVLRVAADSADPAIRAEALEDHADELGRLGDAAESVGLGGLRAVCIRIQENINACVQQDNQAIDPNCLAILADWPPRFLGYLERMQAPASVESLIGYLQDPRWPNPLAAEQARSFAELLSSGRIVVEQEIEERQQVARQEDVSLYPPDDVNPELLDSLLQELPQQTADFSSSIQRLISGNGTLDDLLTAQRVAHTLKGAANTVGIRGIASLTHHLEDILLALSKHEMLPPSTLNDVLIKASDNLETMSEALLGISEAPSDTESLEVLQEVLDWANRIDQQGITAAPEPLRPESIEATASTLADEAPTTSKSTPAEEGSARRTASPATQPAETEAMLRVPTTVVDDLLRLSGESMIVNSQLKDRLERSQGQMKMVIEQNDMLQQLVFELERLIDIQGVASRMTPDEGTKNELDPLEMERYNELHTVTHRIIELTMDTAELGRDSASGLVALDGFIVEQAQLQRENQQTVMHTRMVRIKTVIPRLQRSVRQACRLIGKDVDLQIDGGDTLMDSNVLSELVDPLMHVLRNAVDHGIESPRIRESTGKPAKGLIHLSFTREGSNVVVSCKDDGAGLDYERIREAAQRRGMVAPEQVLNEKDLNRLILAPGFSTRDEATQVSGRGIGMDAIYTRTRQLKGTVNLVSRRGKGFELELKLPVTLSSVHGLLVHAGKQVFGIADRGVEQVVYSGAGKANMIGTLLTYELGDEAFEAVNLETLLGLTHDRRREDRTVRPAIQVRDESGTQHVVLVQDVIDSRDLVVKNMGRYLPTLPGITGATILGDGSVMPVLDLPELLRIGTKSMFATPAAARRDTASVAVSTRPCALVVDDSLSARRSLAQFAEDAGYEVRTAQDGLEAVAVLEAKRADILLVDMEMPRMNGLELTSHVRASKATRDIPVIMITSRSTEKHRQLAKAAGVDAYVTKPFDDDELLYQIEQLTAIRGAA